MQNAVDFFAWYIAERHAMVGTNVYDGIDLSIFSQTNKVPARTQDLPSSNSRAAV